MDLFREVRSSAVRGRAWAEIRLNGQISKCAETRREVDLFETRSRTHLKRITDQLREGRFAFAPAPGVAIARPGKSHRPIVIASLESRIVQRAVLDILQRQSSMFPYLMTRTSFGGIRQRGVPQAVRAAVEAIGNGGRYYLRSNIKEFSRAIPRKRVVAQSRQRSTTLILHTVRGSC